MDTISANETIERISTANYEDETKKDSKKSQLVSTQKQWKYNEPAIHRSMRFIATFLHVKHPFVSNWLTRERCIFIMVTRLMTSTF